MKLVMGKAAGRDTQPFECGHSRGNGHRQGGGRQLLHSNSPRQSGPFVPVNVAALPPDLLQSELFGHVRGAFTGAVTTTTGLFGEADKGSLLLDEIGEMPLLLQAKLLRVLQEGEVRRVGEARRPRPMPPGRRRPSHRTLRHPRASFALAAPAGAFPMPPTAASVRTWRGPANSYASAALGLERRGRRHRRRG
jgi:hypothetical protein